MSSIPWVQATIVGGGPGHFGAAEDKIRRPVRQAAAAVDGEEALPAVAAGLSAQEPGDQHARKWPPSRACPGQF